MALLIIKDEIINGGLGELHPREIALLRKIREEYRYGTIEILTYDGLPKQVLKTVVRESLDQLSTV